MRATRASVVTAILAGAAVCAGPLVGIAAAAPSTTSSSPAANAIVTSNVPNTVTVTFNESINPVTGAPGGSTLQVQRNGVDTGCTASVVNNNELACPHAGGTPWPDGAYHVIWSATAAPTALPDTGTSSGSFDFTVDTTAPAPSTLSPASASRVQSPATVVATYAEKLDHAASTLVVKNSLDHTVSGTAVVTDSGTQSTTTWTPQLALTEGVYTATASATDLAGNTNTTSWQFTVDNTPPAAPTNLSLPAAVNSTNVSSFVVSGDADDSTPGSASTVVVTATDGANTVTFPTATVTSGHWTTSGTSLSSLKDSAANSGAPITFSATAFDVANNQSSAATATAPKDTVAPGAPTVNLANGVTTTINNANTTLGISGTGTAGDGITATAWNTGTPATTTSNTTSVGGDGSYATTLDTSSLADGPIQLDVTETDPAGNASTTTLHLTKDTAAPTPAPSISSFGPVNIANASSPTAVSGTVPSDAASVQVWITDAGTGTTDMKTVVPSGTSFTASFDTTSLAEGVITAHAVAFDAAGNPSDEGQAVSVKDLQAPGDPHFSPAPPAWANLSDYTAYPVGGTADPGADVVVTAADGTHQVSKQLTADETGNWSTTLDLTTLAENTPITLTVTSTDEAGNPAAHSGSASTTKDIHAPATPAAPTVADPTHGNTATVSGTGTAGDSIAISLVSDGGTGTANDAATVAGDGTWTKDVDVTALPDGTLSATAVETDPAGNSSGASPAGHAVKDTTTLAPTSTTPTDGQQLKPSDLNVLSATYNEQIDPATSTIILKDSTGTALQTKNLAVSNGNTTISASPYDKLGDGTYTVIFDVHDLADVEHLVTTVHFVLDDVAPAAPPTITLGNATVANNGMVPVSGTAAEPGGTVTVTVSDGTDQVSGPADLSGTDWTAAVDVSSLANNGALHATATQTDAAGNTSPVSATADGWKDVTAPGKPSVGFSGPANQASSVVTLSGAGEPGDTVSVSVDDTNAGIDPVAGSAVVAGDGTWSKQLDLSSLSDGALTATAHQTDEVGNVSGDQTASGQKDTGAPTSPSISTPAAINRSNVRAFAIGGSGASGDTVQVSVSDGAHAPVTAAVPVTAGAWATSLDLSALADGPVTVTATEVDPAQNASAPAHRGVTKDTVTPVVAESARRAFTLGATGARWTGSDSGTGVATYDVRVARAPHGKALGAYRVRWAGLASTVHAASMTDKPGVTDCFEVRAHDVAGNVSRWTPARCQTVALDDRAFPLASGWSRITGSRFYRGTATVATKQGAKLTLASSALNRVALVVTTCPSCGSITVKVGSWHRTVNLVSATTRRHVLITFATFSRRTAPVVITVTSVGKSVQIDGVGTSIR
ncbi:MAG TPA: Ig-like domain-containing protein [Mycobacteriales bacterium]|nr:Ig-like domain-containing protein [Mycobacteriales bacterium]